MSSDALALGWEEPDRVVRPADPVPVEVLHRGEWSPGTLEVWRKARGRWQGYVIYTERSGVLHAAWRDQEQIRPTTR